MTYAELIAKVLDGKSVNSVAHEMGVPQKSLDRYSKGETFPSVSVTIKMAHRAGISIEEAAKIVAAEEEKVRPKRQLSLPRFAAATAGLVIAIATAVILSVTPTDAKAAPYLASSPDQCILCKVTHGFMARIRNSEQEPDCIQIATWRVVPPEAPT
ncbi:helix-turn-helix transcriptional regulator [Pigmentiphaga sp.]|uniref:helix-turn-helix domain-containing protein n=1 Tax=Pigmentiphaga sp. TaxID=1977564 RepID=UPI0025F3BAC0|nr:helix-turn-helix transcriptional regulator [Pigmentiphaga sp.]